MGIMLLAALGLAAAPADEVYLLQPGARHAVGPAAAGGCWRALVEPAPGADEAGFWFQTDADGAAGWFLGLGHGLTLREAAGAVLWQDEYAPWKLYTPYRLEAVVEPGRLRVQMLDWQGELLSQSDWIAVPQAAAAAPGLMLLQAGSRPARFYRCEQAVEPLSPVVPNSPNKLRLRHGEGTDWRVVGDGEWRWTDLDHTVLRKVAASDRSTAVHLAAGGAEGTWRVRVKVDPGAGGAGLLFAADEALERGFNCWLGGEWGNGGLMLYRQPGDALWSSPQGVWHYDTEYLLEATIGDGKVSVKLYSAEGAELAASPAFDLLAEERGRAGALGYMVWQGTGTFWDFGAAAAAPAADSPLGPGWSVEGGPWRLDGGVLQQLGDGQGLAIDRGTAGIQGVWSAYVTAGDRTRAVALWFQADPARQLGFACRLGAGLSLEALDGRTLWQSAGLRLEPGRTYRLEGIVVTDRVQIRVRDAAGAVLAESTQVYVTDTNNTRRGMLGLACEGGPARFERWSYAAGE